MAAWRAARGNRDGGGACALGWLTEPYASSWNKVLLHAQEKGILCHIVLAEQETANYTWLDGGTLGVERKLLFRELAARFGYLPAVQWNLCEENRFDVPTLVAMADYMRNLDVFAHPITTPDDPELAEYFAVLGDVRYAAMSLQFAPDVNVGEIVETWRARSAAAGWKWTIGLDEITWTTDGSAAADLRKRVLYDGYFSGGQIEWYLGQNPLPPGGDLDLEDFRTRADLWRYTWYARKLVLELPFAEMEPADGLLTGETEGLYGGGEVFAKPGECYAVYLPQSTSTGSLDLSGTSGTFVRRWYDPRTGELAGAPTVVTGGGPVALGPVPAGPSDDWVCLIRRD